MEKPKVPLNPNAAPFIPKFKRASNSGFQEENMVSNVMFHGSAMPEETEVQEVFDAAWEPSTDVLEDLLISGESSIWQDYQMLESMDHVSQYDTMRIEKQELEDSSQTESEYLSSLFPDLSLESINEVYRTCGDVFEAKLMLEQLEGHDVNFGGFFNDPHSSGPASTCSLNDMASDSIVTLDSGAVHHSDSTTA